MSENEVRIDIRGDAASFKRASQEAEVALNKLQAAGDQVSEATARQRAEGERYLTGLQKQTAATEAFQRAWFQNAAGLKTYETELITASDRVQRLLDRYDPLGAKLRQLQSDFAALNKAAAGGELGTKQDAAIDLAYKRLNEEIAKTKGLMQQAGAAGAEGFGRLAEGADRGMFATARARRELMVLAREAMSGDFARMPGSFMVLAQAMDLSVGSLLGLGGVMAGTVGTALALAVAYDRAAVEMREMNNAIAVTGNFAGVTRGQMRDLAQGMADAGTLTIGTSKEIVTQLVASGRLGTESIRAVAQLAEDYAEATGQEVDRLAPELLKLFDDPAKGAQTLNSSMHFLNVTEMEHIQHLVRTGQEEQARLLLAAQLSDHLSMHVQQLGVLERSWDAVKKAGSAAWDAMLGIGRDDTLQDKIKVAQAEAEALAGVKGTREERLAQAKLDNLYAQLAAEKAIVAKESEISQEQERQGKSRAAIEQRSQLYAIRKLEDERKLIELQQVAQKTETDTAAQRAEKDAQAAQKADALRVIATQIADAYRSIGQESRQMTEARLNGELKLYEIAIKMGQEESEAQLKLGVITQAERDKQELAFDLQLNYIRQADVLARESVSGLTKLERERLAIKLQELKADEQAIRRAGENTALEDARKKALEAAKAHNQEVTKDLDLEEQHRKAVENSIGGIDKRIKQIEFETSLIGLSNAERERAVILHELEAQKVLLSAEAYEELRKRLEAALAAKAARQSAFEAAKAAAQEWAKLYDNIERGLVDSLFRGFEQGKSFLESFKDTIKNVFKSLTLTLAVRPILQPMYAGVANLFGVNMSQAGGSWANLGGAGSNAYNMLGTGTPGYGGGMIGGGAGLYGSFATSSIGQSLGLSSLVGDGATGEIVAQLTGAGQALGAALPWVGAAIAAAAILSDALHEPAQFQGRFASDRSRSGAPSLYEDSKAFVDSPFGRFGFLDNGTSIASGETLRGLLQPIAAIEASITQLYGLTKEQIESIGQVLDDQSLDTSGWGGGERIVQEVLRHRMETIFGALDENLAAYVATLSENGEEYAKQIGNLVAALPLLKNSPVLQGLDTAAAMNLIDLAGGVDKFSQTLARYEDIFLPKAERQQRLTAALTRSFEALNLTMPSSNEGFHDLAEGLDRTTEEGRRQFVGLIALADAFDQWSRAAAEAQKATEGAAGATNDLAAAQKLLVQRRKEQIEDALNAVDAAMAAVARAVEAERERLNTEYETERKRLQDQAQTDIQALQDRLPAAEEQVRAIRTVFDAIGRSLEAVQGKFIQSEAARQDEAQRVLDAALAHARAGGSLSNFAGLEDALQTVTDAGTELFASREDYVRAQALTVAKLKELKENGGAQLSVAQSLLQALKQSIETVRSTSEAELAALESQHQADLDRLDQQLAQAQAQVDALHGIDNSVLSVVEAVNHLQSALSAYRTVNSAGAGGSGGGSGGTIPRSPELEALGNRMITVEQLYATYAGKLPSEIDQEGYTYWLGQLAVKTPQEVAGDFRRTVDYLNSLTGFADGGVASAGAYIAGERGRELIVSDTATRIYPAEQTTALMARLRAPDENGAAQLAEIRRLREENARMLEEMNERLEAIENHSRRTANATNGNSEAPVLVEIAQ